MYHGVDTESGGAGQLNGEIAFVSRHEFLNLLGIHDGNGNFGTFFCTQPFLFDFLNFTVQFNGGGETGSEKEVGSFVLDHKTEPAEQLFAGIGRV